jgi:cytochrome c oxidase cbb3-type subunit 3
VQGALRLTLGASICFAAVMLSACGRKNEDVREWRASDHDRSDGSATAGQEAPPSAPQGAMPSLQEFGISDVVLATWKTNCTPCHGIIGRGDGPQGAMVRPPDFTQPLWQKAALDDQMSHAIKKGKGRMPPFPQLPDDTITGLVKLIRLLNSDRAAQQAAPGAATPAAPTAPGAGSATPAPLGAPGTSAAPKPALPASTPAAPSAPSAPSPGAPPSYP